MKVKSFIQKWDYHIEYHYLFYKRGNLIGTVYISDYGKYFELSSLYIQEDFRSLGYSKKILKYILKRYKKLMLTVKSDNLIARKLYDRFNFKVVDSDERYTYMQNY
jgi:ribosomal protein S18 acetylase RimI-like enzyme